MTRDVMTTKKRK